MEHHPLGVVSLTPKGGQRQVGSFAGAAAPGKDIQGAQRSAQAGQNSAVDRKGKSRPDCELTTKARRGESRA